MTAVMICIELPWPSRTLCRNARVHWRIYWKAFEEYKQDCFYAARETLGRRKITCEGKLPMSITFRPPDRRRYDKDNMIGRFKAGQDGLANALGIDDYHFDPQYHMGSPQKQGAVIVQIFPDVELEGRVS